MTHKLSRIGIIIDLKFIYIYIYRVEYSTLLVLRAFWSYIFTRYREWWSIPLFVIIQSAYGSPFIG